MADPFQPKFVDLVRNYTSTTGTGNLALGEPAPGFTSFTAALQPGDRFYYSVMSLDRPTETETGRGTLEADGTITRDPIGGTPTDFSSGSKSVALVAAAEWFETASQFTAAAPGGVSRTVAEKSADVISVRDFGAAGDGVTDDTVAFVAATDHARLTGKAIFVPTGVYMIYPANLQIAEIPSGRFIMFGEGASSVIKVLDGTITASDFYLFRFLTSQDIEAIEFRDLLLDHNARGSPDPAVAAGDEWAFQHSHTLQIAATAGTIKHVRFSNVVIKDPAADGFNCGHSGSASVRNYVIDNCAVVERTRVRSDICITKMPEVTLITGFHGDVIEVETNAATPFRARMHVSNCHLNRLDLAEYSAGYLDGNVEIYLDNVTAPQSCNFDGVMLRASNCKLGISNEINTTQSRWNVLQPGSEISNSTLVHQYDVNANAVATLILWSNSSYNFNSWLKLVNCRSIIDSPDANIAPTGAAISGSTGVTPAYIRNSVLEIINHSFDPRFEKSVYAERCGTVKIIGGELAGRNAAVHYVSGTTAIGQALDCTIDSPDVSRVTGALITGSWNDVDQSAAKAYLRLRGEWKGYNGQPLVTNANSTPTVSRAQLQIKSNRRVLAGATPASGLLGDIIELEGPALAAGSTDSYRCTVSDASAATWKARTALAA